MKRTFNYTERTKITQRSVSVRVYTDADGVQAFDADLDLSQHKSLPHGTQIFLEAYYRNQLMRFPVGTYDSNHPNYTVRSKRLDELQDPVVNFRIKLVDVRERVGRLVGVVERVQVFNQDAKQVDRIGLLPVNFGEDLRNQIWKIEIDDDMGPMLYINKSLNVNDASLRDFIARDPAFVALVFPEALRRILEKLVVEDFDPTDQESWQYKWAHFAASLGSGRLPASDEDSREEWVESVVNAFCEHTKIKSGFEQFMGEKD